MVSGSFDPHSSAGRRLSFKLCNNRSGFKLFHLPQIGSWRTATAATHHPSALIIFSNSAALIVFLVGSLHRIPIGIVLQTVDFGLTDGPLRPRSVTRKRFRVMDARRMNEVYCLQWSESHVFQNVIFCCCPPFSYMTLLQHGIIVNHTAWKIQRWNITCYFERSLILLFSKKQFSKRKKLVHINLPMWKKSNKYLLH